MIRPDAPARPEGPRSGPSHPGRGSPCGRHGDLPAGPAPGGRGGRGGARAPRIQVACRAARRGRDRPPGEQGVTCPLPTARDASRRCRAQRGPVRSVGRRAAGREASSRGPSGGARHLTRPVTRETGSPRAQVGAHLARSDRELHAGPCAAPAGRRPGGRATVSPPRHGRFLEPTSARRGGPFCSSAPRRSSSPDRSADQTSGRLSLVRERGPAVPSPTPRPGAPRSGTPAGSPKRRLRHLVLELGEPERSVAPPSS